MYVTDTPVMERITDTPRWETRIALDALEEALGTAEGCMEEIGERLDGKPKHSWSASNTREAYKGASDALSAVLKASQQVREALALLGIEEL